MGDPSAKSTSGDTAWLTGQESSITNEVYNSISARYQQLVTQSCRLSPDRSRFDSLLYNPRWAPRWGWHDDHRQHDGTPAYLPAVMQVRDEFFGLVSNLNKTSSCLQLGLGPCDASHELWRVIFDHVLTIDIREIKYDDNVLFHPGASTHDREAREVAEQYAPYDLLFIDAGHFYEDVKADYDRYAPMVSPNGIIAFHDALPRAAYPEVEVHRFVNELPGFHMIGTEVGTAWIMHL